MRRQYRRRVAVITHQRAQTARKHPQLSTARVSRGEVRRLQGRMGRDFGSDGPLRDDSSVEC